MTLARFYPTLSLVTGRDIIYSLGCTYDFRRFGVHEGGSLYDVMIHGFDSDGQGRKMSKSLGNGIDPIEVIEQYGADTLLLFLITGTTPGNDVFLYGQGGEHSKL